MHIKEKDLYYQYYESYGLNACFHNRQLYKNNVNKTYLLKWRKLPIRSSDLIKINNIIEKTDDLTSDTLFFKNRNKKLFEDIMNESNEYINTELKKEFLILKSGYYIFDKNSFNVYDKESDFFYTENHKCSD